MINKFAKVSSVSFVLMLLISTIAIAFMIGSETKMVSAVTYTYLHKGYTVYALENGVAKFYSSDGGATYQPAGRSLTTEYLTLHQYDPTTPPTIPNEFKQVAAPEVAPAIETTPTSPAYLIGVSYADRFLATPTKGTIPTPTPAIADVSKGATSEPPLVITAVTPADSFQLNKPLIIGVPAGTTTKNLNVQTLLRDDTGYYTTNGNTRVDITYAQLQTAGIIDSYDQIINSALSSVPGKAVYYSDGNTLSQYRTITYANGNKGYEVSTNNGASWDSTILPSALKDNDGIITGGTAIAKIGENQGITYLRGGSNYFKVDVNGVASPITLPQGAPSNSVPTKFDTNGNPIEWASTNSLGATKLQTFDSAKGEWSASTNRGEIKTIFGEQNFGIGQLIQGAQWAGVAAGIVQTLGGVFGMKKETLDAATAGIAAGILVGKASYALLGRGGTGGLLVNSETNKPYTLFGGNPDSVGTFGKVLSSPWFSAGLGAATAWLTYNAMWSQTKTTVETVTFDCLPWQAPNGGKDCELCNDETLPCSEYRCKSLGQSCEIVNKGTVEERCVNVNPRDSSPPVITPLESEITEGYEYFDVKEMPPGAGFKIGSKTTSNKCIPAYTPIKFAITTNEPSQCKIDIEPKGNYSRMAAYMNGDNLYQYNHTEFLNLPSSADIKNSSLTLKNGKELVFYIRCKDAAGNSNEADYAMTLCVDPSPDTTAPVVQGTSIKNAGCVPADTQNATVEFYINEPAQCRWNYVDTDYEQMKNDMSCSTNPMEINAIQSYNCVTKLNGIARDGTKFFIRCKDQPSNTVNESKRNTNKESYEFTLRGSNQLKLKVLRPNETIYGAVRPTPVELYAETLFGCEDNKAICYYSTTDSANSFIQFFDTDKADGVHTQRLDLNDGTYTYFVRCVDAGGNIVNTSTTFKVSIDVNAPVVARAYEEDGYLKLVTPLNSECVYNSDNCDYLFSEGTQMPYANSTTHVTQWFPDKKYFIKCRDEYRSEPVDCSLVVRPTENFLGV